MMTQIEKPLEQATIDPQGLIFYIQRCLAAAKQGRSMRNDQGAFKYKVFSRSEARLQYESDPKGVIK
jgi:hypothetical protein